VELSGLRGDREKETPEYFVMGEGVGSAVTAAVVARAVWVCGVKAEVG